MIFLRRQLPLLVTLISGLLFAGQYYVPHPASEQMLVAADHRGIRIDLGSNQSVSSTCGQD